MKNIKYIVKNKISALLICTVIGALAVPVTVFAQSLLPAKDAAFGQVAVGPTIETVLTITNRGSFTFSGLLIFRSGKGMFWNPIVNGSPIVDGELELEILPDETITLTVTGDELRTGTCLLLAQDLILDNFLEANLAYVIRDKESVVDTVGVLPSQEFYLASLPFERFADIALALVNGDLSESVTADVRIDLLSSVGDLVDSVYLELLPFEHTAKFLSEIFTDVQLEGGKVEVYSRIPIYGTALRLSEGQLSSLPLDPAPVAYTLRMISSGGTIYSGELSLQAQGFFVKGMVSIHTVDDVELEIPDNAFSTGTLEFDALRLLFELTGDALGERAALFLEHPSFFLDSEVVSGTWVMLFFSDQATDTGTYELTRTTP